MALDHLNLTVPSGSIFGFLGPNGAGKTTTLRLLTGLATATEGTGTVAGVAIGGTGGQLARNIGYLDQDPRFYGWMNGRELLNMVGQLHGLHGAALRQRVGEVLEIVGLQDAAQRRIGGYSGGMRQRLGIGQALINQPRVLFLDEPVSSLDPEGRRDVLEIISRLRGTATVFMSTHILNDVERVCDRVAILNVGHLVVEGPIDELLDRYAQPIYELEPEPQQAGVDRPAGQPDARAALGARGPDDARHGPRLRERPQGGRPGDPAAGRVERGQPGSVRTGAAEPRGRLPAPGRRRRPTCRAAGRDTGHRPGREGTAMMGFGVLLGRSCASSSAPAGWSLWPPSSSCSASSDR